MSQPTSSSRTSAAVVMLLLAGACSSPERQPAVPESGGDRALIAGMPGSIRTWSDKISDEFLEEITRAQARRTLPADSGAGPPAVELLAISGGGPRGAYGAGVLCGWTAAGNRPEFELVTGVSTGALSAPFAFLGPAYDDPLRRLYTTVRTKDILEERGLIEGLFGDSLADSAPLKRLVRKEIGPDVVAAVASEYQEGRLLFVTTTNLDAQRGVIWNMGAIASIGDSQAVRLFQDVLVASASIPGAFPPVMIAVDVDGRRYQEMHVDGGTVTQVFVYPPSLKLVADRKRRLYIIRNARLDPEWEAVERNSLAIAARAIDTLTSAQGFGDLYRIFLTARRDQLDFALAYIPGDFRDEPRELFDPVYMTRLFDIGYEHGFSGTHWLPHPPGYVPLETQPSKP